jgi:signal peptidase I
MRPLKRLSALITKLRYRADMRIVLYRGAKLFAVILAVGLLFKFFGCDSVRVAGSQMEPAVLAGDRILLMRAPYATPLLRNLFDIENKLTVAAIRNMGGENTISRIAAISGDTVSIDAGQFYRNRYAVKNIQKDTARYGLLPAEYSPADFMAPYRIPAPKDSISFAGLTLRDLIFAYSVLRQERSGIRLNAFAMAGDSIIDNYRIKDFSLYRGPLDSIPDELASDWFFWARLQDYLKMKGDADGVPTPQLAFSIFKGNKELSGFRVKKRYVFLMGDHWTRAKDSRYFGPVGNKYIMGKPVVTLWGSKGETGGRRVLVLLK